ESCPGGGMFLLGHLAKPSPHLSCFVEWRDKNSFRRTKIPPQGSFSPSPICISDSGDRALLYKAHGLSGESEGPHSLLLCLRETGEIRDLGKSDFASIRSAQITADNKELIGVGEEFGGSSLHLIKMDLATLKWSKLEYMEVTGIADIKLIDGGRSLAIATRTGDFRVIDLATGNTLRHRTGLRYHPPRVIWYVLGATAAVWLALWWRATTAAPTEPVAWGRYQGLLIFSIAIFVGLLLLGYRDERLRQIHGPTLTVAIAGPMLGALAGGATLFTRKSNKLVAAYTLAASIGIAAYLSWLMFRKF
ncbi:MAG: hypothetical protein K8R36_19805, partial [Planctomycetales bacterium]|nr:hypothetical protein [Planctomycetales bacterium]